MPALGGWLAQRNGTNQKGIVEALRSAGKAWFEDLTRPLIAWLDTRGVTPNQVSTAGLIVTLTSTPLIATGWLTTGALVFGFGSLTDALDGALARRRASTSKLGAFLDSTFDRIGEGAALGALAVYFADHRETGAVAATAVALIGGNLTSYIRARAEALGIECEVGWASRTERVCILGFGMLFHVQEIMIYLLAALTAWTATQRMWHVYRRVDSPSSFN